MSGEHTHPELGGGLPVVSVTAHGAKGDGSADDTAAIRAAIAAAGVGGTVAFPKVSAHYRVSASLRPLERQTWIGQHSPRYSWNQYPAGASTIRAASAFTGSALIHNTPPVAGVTIRGLCLLGNGETGTLDGIDFGPASGSERAWLVEGCTLNSFGGAAVCGFGWVVTLRGNHISRNGWGISPHRGADGNSRFNDSTMTGNYVYFNLHHAIELGGPVESGLLSIIGNRVERSGVGVVGDTYDPNAPSRDPNAAGIHITRATCVSIVGNTSDANTGPGLSLDAATVGAVNNVTTSANVWKRDGIGTNSGADQIPGVRISGASYSSLADTITYGDPDDAATNLALVVPKRGIEFGPLRSEFVAVRGSIQLRMDTATAGVVLTVPPWQSTLDVPRQKPLPA